MTSPELLVYDNRKNVLPGYHTALTETESCDALERVWMRDSRMIGYCVYNKEEGIYIRNVSSGRPASVAGFQVGDWVEGIDGRKIAKSDEVWAERDKITDGSRQHLLMELRRGAKTHWYILTK
jgi:C-terminal processing protease CtpA/Prc